MTTSREIYQGLTTVSTEGTTVGYGLLLFIIVTLIGGCRSEEEGIRPSIHTITEAVYSSATVVPVKRYTVYPSVAGIVEASMLEEGIEVNEDDVLLRVKSEQADWERKKAQLQYEQAKRSAKGEEAVLREMTERINSARAQLRVDSSTYARQRRLWEQNIGSRQTYEAAQLKLETSQNQLRELRNAYDRTKSELEAQMKLAGAVLDQRRSAYAEFLVRAEFAGTVYEVFVEEGESITPQTPIATIGSTDDFIVRLSIDEVDIARVKLGQEVIIGLDAYQEQSFTATLTKISPQKDERTQTYAAEAVFKRGPDRLFAGLSGEANIIISRRTDVLALPAEFIGSNGKVVTAEGEQRVKTGVTDFRYTEIISGIDTNTVVFQVE